MAARKWTDEQKARQAALIRTWAPWTVSTGPRTPNGKAVSSKNAVNYSLRELLREMARQNRVLIGFINGMTPVQSWNRTTIDGLLNDVEKAVDAATARQAKNRVKPMTTTTGTAERTGAHANAPPC
jgi:hypothetical protein